jgi:hypothetical protein
MNYVIDESGRYLGAFDDASLPDGAITVDAQPENASDLWNGSEWVTSTPADVPQKVTMRQARLALLAAGLLDDVEAAIDALPEPPRRAARIEWEFSSEVFRDRDFVLMLGQALGLDSQEMDDLFITAATL